MGLNMNVRVVVLAVVGLVMCLRAGDAQQGASLVPVPASAFKGTLMSLPDWGFSVESPAKFWTWAWMKIEQPVLGQPLILTQFVGSAPDETERFLVSIAPPSPTGTLTQFGAEKYLGGLMSTRVRRGWTVGAMSCTPWSAFEGGWRCSFPTETPEAVEMLYVAYLVSAKHFYVLQSLSPGKSEPPAFRTFVSSFKLLK